MNFIEQLKALISKNFATEAEKELVQSEFKKQSAEVQSVAGDLMKEVKELSTDEPSVDDEIKNSIKNVFAGEKKEMARYMKEEILESVQNLLDKHKAKKNKKVGVYSAEAKKNKKRQAINNYLREGLVALISGADTEKFEAIRNDMTTDDSATPYAGFITDSYLSAEIRHLITEYGVAAREFTTISFMESSYKANTLTTDVSVEWVDEGAAIGSTQVVLGQSTLTIKKLAAIVTLTRELLQEQEIDFVSFIGSRVAEGFAQAEDEAFFIGDGSSTYGGHTGLLKNTSTNNVAMAAGDIGFANVSVEKLRAMQDATPAGALKNAKYYLNRTILTQVRNLREDAISVGDGAGAFIYKAPQGTEHANIDGFPIVLVEAMPAIADTAVSTAFVLFGDVKKATIRGVRGGIITDRFDAGTVRNTADDGDSNLITTDRHAIRWINQVGYIAILPTAVTRLTTAAV